MKRRVKHIIPRATIKMCPDEVIEYRTAAIAGVEAIRSRHTFLFRIFNSESCPVGPWAPSRNHRVVRLPAYS